MNIMFCLISMLKEIEHGLPVVVLKYRIVNDYVTA